jgi:hypothetical protein
MMIAIKVSMNKTPEGGMRSASIKLSRSVPTVEENNKAPMSPRINAIRDAASMMKPFENPFTAPKITKPTIATSI